MMNRFARLCLVSGVILWCLSGTARRADAAQDSAATASAKAHFKTGTTFYDLGKFDEAIREFESAYEAKSDPAFLFNLAQANRLAGHAAEALHLYRTYLRYVPDPPNLSDIQNNIHTLEKLVSERPATSPGAPPTMDSSAGYTPPVGPTSVSPPPPPSAVAPMAAPPGAPPVLAPRPLTPEPVDAQRGAQSAAPVSDGPPGRTGSSSRRNIGKVLTVVGAGVFAGGIIFGLLAGAQSRKVESAVIFDPAVENNGKTFDTLKWVGLVAGAITAAAGVVLYATSQSAPAETTPRTALLPLAGPHLGGAILQVSFR
jgi:hypothetical protein